jgi:hypothetical protein
MRFKFDIDNTIIFSKVNEKGLYEFVGFDRIIRDKINRLYEEGHIIIIETGRHWNQLEITIKQLQMIDLKYHTLIMGKPPVDHYVEDKALKPSEFKNMELK